MKKRMNGPSTNRTRFFKFLLERWNDTSGMSIISVMAAFIVLLIGIMMTTTAMTAALRIMQDSNENRIITENAVEYYYTGSGEGTMDSQYIMQDFIFTSNNGGENFSIKGNVGKQYNYTEAVKSQDKTYRFFAFDKRKFTGEKTD